MEEEKEEEEQDDDDDVHCFSCKVLVIRCQILMKLEYTYTKFHTHPSSGSRVVPRRRMNRHTHMTKLIIAFGKSCKFP